MATIALFDDRANDRRSLKRNIDMHLPPGWSCIAVSPLPDPSEYRAWVLRHQVQAIVLDWVLDELKEDVDAPVTYKGHVLVTEVRKHFPHMPIFVVTAQPADHDLRDHTGQVEFAITRAVFSSDPKQYVQVIVRAGERFAKNLEDDLSRLSALAERAATGVATDPELKELRAIQASLNLASSTAQEDCSRAEALKELESALQSLENDLSAIKAHMRSKGA